MNGKPRVSLLLSALSLFLLLALPALGLSDSQWVLSKSTLSYHVSHPLHEMDGVSHDSKGKGVCHSGECDFLVAVPLKSFDSGDSNRDLHMLQVTRGAQYPMVTVRFDLPQAELNDATIRCDLQIQFAGQAAQYKQVVFHQVIQGDDHHITGTIPATVSDFKIDPPKLFTIPIKNEIPVSVDMNWEGQK
jgi:hypothetical protein